MGAPSKADAELIRWILGGDRNAFQALYDRYRDRVFATVYRILGNHEEAVDVSQDVFIKVYRDLGSFRFDSQFSTWLYRIAVNFSINKLHERERHGRAHRKIARDASAAGPADAEVPRDRVQAAIGRLNPKLRTVVVLRYLQGLAYEEIAQALELSVGTVKSRLHLAHNALRESLGDLGRDYS